MYYLDVNNISKSYMLAKKLVGRAYE